MMYEAVCILTDLHVSPPQTAGANSHLELIQTAVQDCDLLIYSGDILTMDGAGGEAYYTMALNVAETIGKPFMFTLGNHDGAVHGAPRQLLLQRLTGSALHEGVVRFYA
jgi:hypothetical protein